MITPFILTFLLIFARTLGLIGTSPLFGDPHVPATWKIGLAFYLAVAVESAGYAGSNAPLSMGQFIVGLLIQSLVGAGIGLLASMVFAAVQVAGELADIQMGLSVASLLGPGMASPSGLVSNLYYLIFALWFFAVNGHYAIIMALLDSFRFLPVTGHFAVGPVQGVFLQSFVTLFIVAVQLSAPILFALFLANVSMAAAARAVPQINVFSVGLNVTLLAGLVLLLFVMPELVSSFSGLLQIFESELTQLIRVLGGRPA